MGWEYGIPDGLGPYTYFASLNNSLSDAGSIAKKQLYDKAVAEMERGLSQLTNIDKITAATDFIKQVADSERGKELAAIQSYCKEMHTQFPALEKYLNNPQAIYDNPQHFYLQLTKAINEIRVGTDEYLRELRKIKSNIDSLDAKGQNNRTFYNYLFDDYRYKLVEDITVFMAHLTHHENWIKEQLRHNFEETSFHSKIEAIAMRILKESNMTQLISSGEDFAAIAASVLIDLEKNIQQEIDNSLGKENKTINQVSNELLAKVEKKYLSQLQRNPQSPVQKALSDINGIDFKRVTNNAKELLGIKISDQITSDQKEIQTTLSEINKSKDQSSQLLQDKLQGRLPVNLDNSLQLVNFSIAGSRMTKHGSINELILSLWGSNVKGNVATDVINYKLSWETQINTAELDTLVKNLGDEFSSVLTSEETHNSANKTNIRPAIQRMQKNVDNLIAEAEKQLKASKQFDPTNDIFIFHETLKLYSAVETGRNKNSHAGFGGRNMNILSYIDYLSSASSVGVKNNIDRDILAFFARNLIKGAIAERAKAPLEFYFSIFAGMIMFDDVIAMAQEAILSINNSNTVIGGKIRQVHLYNLNGIYVPASMILTYLSDSLNKDNTKIIEEMMQVHINTGSVYDNSNRKISNRTKEKQNHNIKVYEHFMGGMQGDSSNLTQQDWDEMSSIAINNTKVQIIFLASFQQFINRLFGLS